jgi:hypothetical protein
MDNVQKDNICIDVPNKQNKLSSLSPQARTIPTERPPLNRIEVSRGQRNESPRPLISVF